MNVFMQFIKSLHSPKHIAMFRFQGIGKTILYIFVFMFITLIPSAFFFTTNVHETFQNLEIALQTNTPSFQIENGTLQADFDEPYISNVNGDYLIIDPNGELTSNTIAHQYDRAVVFGKHEAYLVTENHIEEVRYQSFGNISMSKDELRSFMNSIAELLPLFIPLGLIFIYLFITGLKFVGVSVLAIVGLVLTKIVQANKINYRHLWIMAAYSATLPTTLFNVADAFYIQLPATFWIYWAIAIGMLYAALHSIRKRQTSRSDS